MARIITKRDPRSGTFGFDKWNLDVQDDFAKIIEAMIREALTIATEKYECHAWFPVEWGDHGDGVDDTQPADPTTIYVELPLGPDEDTSPRWSFTLTDIVDGMIGLNECGANGYIDESIRKSFEKLRNSLRGLADRVDEALRRPRPQGSA